MNTKFGLQVKKLLRLFEKITTNRVIGQCASIALCFIVIAACFASLGQASAVVLTSIAPETRSLADLDPPDPDIVQIYDWQGGRAGAASITEDEDTEVVDLEYVRAQLNAHNFKGTFYLPDTGNYTQPYWDVWQSIYDEGHELGGHTEYHDAWCDGNDTTDAQLYLNRDDILGNITGISPEDVTSLAWPCGKTYNEQDIADDYYISARGYYWNQLEDKDPADFMNLKSINTAGLNHGNVTNYNGTLPDPLSYPPNPDGTLTWWADQAEGNGTWAIFVFHFDWDRYGLIDYLPTKDLWVAPVGDVAKYIKERQNSTIDNLQNPGASITFNLVNGQDHNLYNQELTLKVAIGEGTVQSLKINDIYSPFTPFNENGTNYIKFNVLPTGNDAIEILTQPCSGNCQYGPSQQETPICQYASGATATSEQPVEAGNALAIYATGEPNAPGIGSCSSDDYLPGYSWAPVDPGDPATLTLTYDTPVYAGNFTIYGDLGMNWQRMWLKNSATGEQLLVFDYLDAKAPLDLNCISTHYFDGHFLADTVILQKGTQGWSATDAVELCGNLPTPTVYTSGAGNVTTDSATLNGYLNGLGGASSGNVSFQYATDAYYTGNSNTYDGSTSPQTMGAIQPFDANLDSLVPGTTYHFRAKAIGDGTAYGDDVTFTTSTTPPTVITDPARDITTNSATLNGNLTSLGTATSVQVSFQYATDAYYTGNGNDYDNETATQPMTLADTFSAPLSSLTPSATYHFRAKAIGDGTSYGNDTIFATQTLYQIRGVTGEVNCALLPGASVDLYSGTELVGSTTSDSNGNYTLTALETGTYQVVISKSGFRGNSTQGISITDPGEYTLDFIGETGLVPDAPDMSYVLACVNHWIVPNPPCSLTMSKVLAVVNAWIIPL